jgi:hypothetical protein
MVMRNPFLYFIFGVDVFKLVWGIVQKRYLQKVRSPTGPLGMSLDNWEVQLDL